MLNYGGGFIFGHNNQLFGFARACVLHYGAVVVCISYRLAPENPWPAGHNDAWDSFLWISANASSLGADPALGFIVGGVSAGGNLSAIIAQHALTENRTPPITGLWLCVPLVFPRETDVPDKYRQFWVSREQNAWTPVIDKKVLSAFNKYLVADYDSSWYTPGKAPNAFKGWPKTYVQVDGMDPLRDDGIILEKILRENGSETRLTAWPGLPHAHFSFYPDNDFSKSAVVDTIKGLGWLLGKEAPSGTTNNGSVGPQ